MRAEPLFGPDLDSGQGADRDHVAFDLRILAMGSGEKEPALGVARRLLCMRENVPDVAAEALVLRGSRLEPGAKFGPRHRGVEDQAGLGLGDRQEEAGPETLAKACGYDETALVVKAVFD